MNLIDVVVISIILTRGFANIRNGILYPKDSETRETQSLNGFWDFLVPPLEDQNLGDKEKWYQIDIRKLTNLSPIVMPVPASYNDITANYTIRQNVGPVWYQTTFFVPKDWAHNTRVWLRFSAVMYSAKVWVNDKMLLEHSIGHLPFQNEVTSALKFGEINRLTVKCDNELNSTTIPQGTIKYRNSKNGMRIKEQQYNFDFFNYAGISRPVTLFTTPFTYIDDITIRTDLVDNEGHIQYEIDIKGKMTKKTKVFLKVMDDANIIVAKHNGPKGTIIVEHPKLWWPYLMHDNPGYLYTLQTEIKDDTSDNLIDIYRQKFGIRSISFHNSTFMINGRSIYLRGLARHEDSDIRGKGLDLPLVARDYSLIKWLGVNAYRTSHYPYADEIMDMADRNGIMIIDECPSDDTDDFSDELLENHVRSLSELWNRDKNRPSVIMWSVSNEPLTYKKSAGQYFKKVIDHIRHLDNSRPITLANYRDPNADHAFQYVDIIMYNHYYGWYNHPGYSETVFKNLKQDCENLHNKFKKKILISEYGAGAFSGMHSLPSLMYTEDYQTDTLKRSFRAFDVLRKKDWFIGEFVFNFADFETKQWYERPGGNMKGIFTRERQPKASAFVLRDRYWKLAHEIHNISLPC